MSSVDSIVWDDYQISQYSNVEYIEGKKRFEIMYVKDLGFKAYMYVTPKGCDKECAIVVSNLEVSFYGADIVKIWLWIRSVAQICGTI